MVTQPGSDVNSVSKGPAAMVNRPGSTVPSSQPEKVQLVTQQYVNKIFEFVQAQPIITASEERVRLPFGIELAGRYTELPVFAGGTHDRSFLQVSMAVPAEFAEPVDRLEGATRNTTAFQCEWSSSIVDKGDCKILKARLDVTSGRPTNFRTGQALAHRWPALKGTLDTYGNLRGASARVASSAEKVWKVNNKIGITWKLQQIDFEPCESCTVDHFAS